MAEIVLGEVTLLLTATRRGSRWTSSHGRSEEDQDPLILGLYQLQDKLNKTRDLSSIDVTSFIKPFCQIVQSDDTTGPVTGMAIASLEKFLAYGLIDPTHSSAPSAIETLSEAVTHARFVGTNPASDEVVLMKILQVLRTLLLSPVGRLLTNESVCEIMQSCFRICFEMRLSELLRCFGESTLVDLVQLLFTRLATFSEDPQDSDDASSIDQTLLTPGPGTPPPVDFQSPPSTEDPIEETGQSDQSVESPDSSAEAANQSIEKEVLTDEKESVHEKDKTLTPYGLPCVRELLRFLVSIINTEDRRANSEPLVAIGLNLVTIVLECGSSHLCSSPGLAVLIQDNLCKYLFKLLRHDSFVLFSRSLRCCCLLFQSCRPFLKLQLEVFMNRLLELIADGSFKVVYEKKELALETMVQLCHTPYFTAELYVNFDCGLYCTNVFESLTKVLSKNSFPTQGAISSTHILSLDALLAITNSLETDSHVTSSIDLDTQHINKTTSNTRMTSAGIIFSSHVTDTVPSMTTNDEDMVTELTPSRSALPLSETKALSRSHDIMGPVAINSNDDIIKPASGYQMGIAMNSEAGGAGKKWVVGGGVADEGAEEEEKVDKGGITCSKELLKVRQKKKMILSATEQFNKKPKQGIIFLMEQGILSSPLDPSEVANFLRENPGLSKAKIGDYIGERKNSEILENFVSKQPLHKVPMVDALRDFLESFRLPGEAPVVERILEVFSEHWLASNSETGGLGEVFANNDSVHVLSYAIIMLNTDLHSNQVKKKMTLNEFFRNQRKTNNGGNFPEPFLTEIYNKIKEEEIIMPDEHSGSVRENYQWKVLLQQSLGPDGSFMGVSNGEFDQDLFLLSWGPTIAALSYVYDHADDKNIAQKAIAGFSNCASVAAHYELKEVFDNLIISLCKFTTLLNTHETSSSLYYLLGVNPKAKQSVQTTFSLANSYGNILREGWKDLLDCLLALFKARLLPQQMVEAHDFLHPEGKVSLFRDEAPTRNDNSILYSFYNYLSFAQESGPSPSSSSVSGSSGGVAGGRGLSTSEGKARSAAMKCIQDCHPEQLFTESRFLKSDALLELVKALIFASRGPDQHQSLGTQFDEDAAIFFLELLVTVAIENKDRVRLFWKDVSSHLSRVISSATQHHFLLERGVVSLLHLALRLLGRGDSPIIEVLLSLQILLSLPPPAKQQSLTNLYRQTAHGVNELVHRHAPTLTTSEQWEVLLAVLEFAGVGRLAKKPDNSRKSSWAQTGLGALMSVCNSFDSLGGQIFAPHEPQAFLKTCECLSFIVRSDHLITPANFSICTTCIRHMTEVASLDSSTTYVSSLLQLLDLLDALYSKVGHIFSSEALNQLKNRTNSTDDSGDQDNKGSGGISGQGGSYCPVADMTEETCPGGVENGIGGGLMWKVAWCPLLQGMARMCCDSRRSVRQTSITNLQRALLSHDLHNLTGEDWHACFTQVFFPMLTRLLENIETGDRLSLEETRVRASNLLCKVFLQHLPSLTKMSECFVQLWMDILHYMDKFLHLENSELLHEAIPESLKNMLLVMSTQGVFDNTALNVTQSDPSVHLSKRDISPRKFWIITWNRIEEFLPNFLSELFPHEKSPTQLLSPREASPSRTKDVGTDQVEERPNSPQEQRDQGSGQLSSPEGAALSGPPSPTPASEGQPPPAPPADQTSSPAVSPGSSPSHSRYSPVRIPSPSSSSEADPSFPITLHPPLPTLAQNPTQRTSPIPGSQNQFNESSSPDSSPPQNISPHGSIPSHVSVVNQGSSQIPVPGSIMGPILGPAAPPYSGSSASDLVSSSSTSKVQPVQFSSVYSL